MVYLYIIGTLIFLSQIYLIIQNKKTMATLAELQQAVSDLQTSVDTKQDAIAAAIKALEDQIAAGGTITEADLTPIVESLRATQADVESTPTS